MISNNCSPKLNEEPQQILIFGAHPKHGHSMRQYSANLLDAYRENGYDAHLLAPTGSKLSTKLPRRLTKLVTYYEKLFLFPIQLKRILRRYEQSGGVCIHIADHSDAFWLLFPWVRRHPTAVTCHDLIAIKAAYGLLPEHRPRLLGRLYQRAILRGLSRTDIVCPVSRTTEMDCRNFLSEVCFMYLPNPVRLRPAVTHSKYHESTRFPYFALVVSTKGWRKRREIAVRVWSMLAQADSNGDQLQLVLVGPPLDDEEANTLDCAHVRSVHTLSDITDEKLSMLYTDAAFIIQSSKYEGFGLPVIESNAHGTPALCADEPIFREVGGPNVFFDPSLHNFDAKSILGQLESLKNASPLAQNAEKYSKKNFVNQVGEVGSLLACKTESFKYANKNH